MTDADPCKLTVAAGRRRHLRMFGAFFVVGLVVIPGLYGLGVIGIETVNMLGRYLAFGIVAIGLDLIWGYTGILSLCQAFFFALGGYAMGMYLAHHGPLDYVAATGDHIPRALYVVSSMVDSAGVDATTLPPFWLPFRTLPATLLLAILVPALVALVIGFCGFVSRVRGVYFAILTQAITVAAAMFFSVNNMRLCGTNGLTNFKTIAGFWPDADGRGKSLEIHDMAANYGDGVNWRPSSEFNGTPGGGEYGTVGGDETATAEATPTAATGDNLAITEIMYHPVVDAEASGGAGWRSEDFEYIEVVNRSGLLSVSEAHDLKLLDLKAERIALASKAERSESDARRLDELGRALATGERTGLITAGALTLAEEQRRERYRQRQQPRDIELAGVAFTRGIDFKFGPLVLPAGGHAIVVRNREAFASRYGDDQPVAGEYAGSLRDGGERLALADARGGSIHDFAYGGGGFALYAPHIKLGLYFVTLLALAAVYWLCRYVVHSRLGRVLVAIRDNENSLRFSGYRPYTYKLFVFVLAAALAGLGGMLYVPQANIITPNYMEATWSIVMVVWVAVGGRGTLVGAIVGSLAVNLLYNFFTSQREFLWFLKGVVSPETYQDMIWKPDYWLFILGGLFISVVLFFPDGLVSVWKRFTGSKRVSATPASAAIES